MKYALYNKNDCININRCYNIHFITNAIVILSFVIEYR